MIYAKDNKIININKDVIIDGVVKGGRKYASIENLNKLDIYEVVEPTIESNQKRGAMYFDSEKNVYTYKIIDITPDYYAIFDTEKANKALFDFFLIAILTERPFIKHDAIIMELIKVKGFNDLNKFTTFLYQMELFTEQEYTDFLSIFEQQNINLKEYTATMGVATV